MKTNEKSAKRSEGINCALLIIWKVSTWTDAAGATRAWLVGIAAPATKDSINAAVLIAKSVLPI